jgi:hypothetical protein
MPVDITYTDHRQGAVLTASGPIKAAELITATNEVFARDFAIDPLLCVLVDGSEATVAGVTGADVRAIANADVRVSGQIPNLAVAVLARKSITYGLARMWQAYVEHSGWATAVFRDRTAAVTWLKEEVAARTGVSMELN